jgi:filamentous hemagglutinin family protein
MIAARNRSLKVSRAGLPAPRLIVLAVALAFSPIVRALPTGEAVVSGRVSVARPDARNMVVQQGSSKAIVNWQSFGIGASESVAFRQPGASSVILNRVVGGSPSDIFGRLSANGQVFLVNPSGVFFAPGASVDVGGLVASTLNITDADFLAGRYRFAGNGSPGNVTNQGTLQAAPGGTIALLGGQVSNDGTISAQLGTVALAAGNRVSLDFAGDGLTKITVDEAVVGAQVRNSGMIVADGGQAILTASAAQALADTVINQEGIVRARSLAQRNGRIVLDGGEAGATLVSGSLDASGQGSGQTGGAVSVLGYHVGLTDQASIDASGSAGGGTVLIGGDYQGNNPAVRNAAATYFGPRASIKADALQTGNGGKVILWSDGPTRAYGTISARGGPGGGNGGLVETSGHWLDVAGARVSAAAPAGVAGDWLLDPGDVTITHSSVPVSALPGNGIFSTEGFPSANASLSDYDISAALSAGTDVTVRAEGDGYYFPGSITVSGSGGPGGAVQIENRSGGARTLSLVADGSVYMDDGARISATGSGNALGLVVLAQGRIRVDGVQIRSNGGNVSMFAASEGVGILGSVIDAGSGQISILGRNSVEGNGVGLGCAECGDTVLSTTGSVGAITISGESTFGGAGIWSMAATIGGPQTSGNIVLRATSVGGLDSLVLDGVGTSTTIQTTGTINIRPGGVTAAGVLIGSVDVPIDVGGPTGEGASFVLTSGELGGIQPGYAALVIGSDQHRGQITVAAPASFSGNVTLQNTGAGGTPGGIHLLAPLTSSGTLTLASSGNITQQADAPIAAVNLLVHSNNRDATVTLNSPGNQVGTLAADPPATFSFYSGGALTIGALSGTGYSASSNAPVPLSIAGSSAYERFLVHAAGNLTLYQGISTLAPNSADGPSIELVTGGALINRAGALTPYAGENWVVRAHTYEGENRGGLSPGNAQPNFYGCGLDGSCVAGVVAPTTGNHFIYEQQPAVTVRADDQLVTFGSTGRDLSFTPDGLVNGDTARDVLVGALTTTATRYSPVGLYAITQATEFTSPVGYRVAFQAGQVGVQALPDIYVSPERDRSGESGETNVLGRNIGTPPMCLATGSLMAESGSGGENLLDLEWSRVRLRPNVTNCVALSERNTCRGF